MDQQAIAHTVRDWIVGVLTARPEITRLAVCQRAKFEGWLKFELAAWAENAGAQDVILEAPLSTGQMRADLGFTLGGMTHVVELKTPNANWRMDGVVVKGRPVTKNIASIVEDGNKMRAGSGGIVAFTFFPVPVGDHRWREYLKRIALDLEVPLSEADHCARVLVQFESGSAEIVVCAFWLGPMSGPTSQDLRAVASFGSLFEAPGFVAGQWHEPTTRDDGVIEIGWWDPSEPVSGWSQALYDSNIIDMGSGYLDEDNAEFVTRAIDDPALIADLDLPAVRRALTFLARAERHTEGGWYDRAFESGMAQAATRRLGQLAD